MSEISDKPITWRDAIELGVGFAAEYAMLALIEDSSFSLKAATMLCAAAAFIALKREDFLNEKIGRESYRALLVTLVAIWVCFAIYAVGRGWHRLSVQQNLQLIYSSATPLTDRKIPISLEHPDSLSKDDVSTFKKDFEKWEQESANWILTNVGETARDQFLDRSNITVFSWGDRFDNDYNLSRNRLAGDRRNLIAIMESRIYD